MDFVVGRRVPLPGSVSPHSISLSQCGVLAAVTLQGVHLFEMVAAVNRKEAFQFLKRTITPPVEINPLLNADGQNRLALNRDIHFKEIHDIFLDRTLSPSRVTDEPLNTAFRTPVAWSPVGLLQDRRCLLVTVTADHRVQLHRRGRECWAEVEQLSSLLTQHVDPTDWPDPSMIENQHSEIFAAHKTASYLRATIAAAWSPLYQRTEGNFALLVTLQRSGHVAVWKIERTNKSPKIIFAGFHDLQMTEPSALQLEHSTGHELLLFAGSHHGVVKCWSLSWADEAKTTCHLLGPVISELDEIPVNVIDVATIDNRLVVCTVKQHVIVGSVIQCDANGLEILDQQFVLLPTMRIIGFTRLANGNGICMTEDYSLNGVNLKTNGKGLFTCLKAAPFKLPCSPTTMLCRGFSASPNCSTLFVLEHIKVPFNHLQCREPTNLVVYVSADLDAVCKSFTHSRKMDMDTLLALETYKSLYGGNWETILDYKSEVVDLSATDVFSLYLMRWFAMYKEYCCSADRRVDREVQTELESRVEKVEIVLQLRHIKATLATLLSNRQRIDNKQLTDNEEMVVGLTKQFIRHECTADVDCVPIVQEIKKQIATRKDIEMKYEHCPMCQEPILFERRLDGSCSNGHGAYRCRATLLICFDVMRTCRWCGAFYHLDAGLDDCILCGGPCG